MIQGLSIPILSALGPKSDLDETSQERLISWVCQDGKGAQILFSAGTTGEWNRIEPAQLRRVNEICQAACRQAQGPQLWAGVTSLSMQDTLANLEHAITLGVPAVVLAPLSIVDAPPPLEFFNRHLIPLYQRLGSSLPLCLYDNADIAVKTGDLHLRTRDVKKLSRLEFVFGIKVSASLKVLGNYLKAARHFKDKHEFGIYLGNANLSFSIFGLATGFTGKLRKLWTRFILGDEIPAGVVAGPANLFPREWRRAWQACLENDAKLIESYKSSFEALSKAWNFTENGKKVSKSLACMKAALYEEGILASETMAKGGQVLSASQREVWLEKYRQIKDNLAKFSPEGWTSKL